MSVGLISRPGVPHAGSAGNPAGRPALLLAALAVLLFLLPASVRAQSYVIADSVRLPAESFVGDSIELRYTIRTEAGLQAPTEPPTPDWGEIEWVRVVARDGEYDLRILITPYEPGTLTLPRLDLDGIELDELSVTVTSVLGESAELRSIYGPQRLPGTHLAILLVVLVVVVPGVLTLYFLGPGRSVLRALAARHRARVPYRNLLRTLDRLEANIKRVTSRDLYTSLVVALQDLMTSRLGFDCRAATSTELRGYLPLLAARCGTEPDRLAPVAEVLDAADTVKFAHGQVRRKVRLRHLAECREAMIELEANRRRMKSQRQEVARVGA